MTDKPTPGNAATERCDQGWNHRRIHQSFWLLVISWAAMLVLTIGLAVAYV